MRSHLLPILALSLSSSLDNVGVGVAYGVRGIRVPLGTNLLIAFMTGLGTLAAMLIGQTIGNLLRPNVANLLGGSVMVLMGIWIIAQEGPPRHKPRMSTEAMVASSNPGSPGLLDKVLVILNNPVTADSDSSNVIDVREGIILGIALSLNNLVNGAAAGMAGFSPLLTTSLVIAISVLTLWMGITLGYRMGKSWLGSFSGMASGLMLIALGIYETLV